MAAAAPWQGLWPRPVRTVDAQHVTSNEIFRDLLGDGEEPLLLRGAPLAAPGAGGASAGGGEGAARFCVGGLAAELGELRLPARSVGARVRSGGNTSSSGCTLFITKQGEEAVLNAFPKAWDPAGCTFRAFADSVAGGSGHYLTTRSGKGACRRLAGAEPRLVYEAPAVAAAALPAAEVAPSQGGDGGGGAVDPDGYDVLVQHFVPRVPWPLLLPEGVGFQVAFWLGAMGNNFGLHTDLFAEQFIVQHEGVKEVLLLLPEDASLVAPFPYLSSPLWYKSERRSVSALPRAGRAQCLRAELRPGDVLYLPVWWWHEVRTISPGVSLSTTFRFHTEDAERFSKVMNAVWQMHDRARRRPSGRLARHLRSYLANGLARAEEEGASAGERSKAAFALVARPALALAAAALLGFAVGRRMATPRAP